MSTFLHKYQPKAVLRVTGEDAGDYLQSQYSSDLKATQENLATYGLWLSRKGKVEGDGFVLRRSDEDFLIVSYLCPGEVLHREVLLGQIILREVFPSEVLLTTGDNPSEQDHYQDRSRELPHASTLRPTSSPARTA